LNKPVQAAAPVLRIVPVTIDMPNMLDLILFEKFMGVLADSNQAVFVAARNP
jgi:hypothetical protein